MCAQDIGLDEGVRIRDRTVNVAFSGEMHHKVEGVKVKQRLDQRSVADVAMDELEMLRTPHGVEIGAISRVSERIEHDDQIVWMPLSPIVDKIGADETRAASDQELRHFAV